MHTVYILHTVFQKVFIGTLGIKNSFRKFYFGNYEAKITVLTLEMTFKRAENLKPLLDRVYSSLYKTSRK